jgi:hypothetical protein
MLSMSSTTESSPSGHRQASPDDTIEAHYASLERGIPCNCYGSGVVVLTIEEDGQEHEELVPCRRCSDSR